MLPIMPERRRHVNVHTENRGKNRPRQGAAVGTRPDAARLGEPPVPGSEREEKALLPAQLHAPDEEPVRVRQAGEPRRREGRDGQLQEVQEAGRQVGRPRPSALAAQVEVRRARGLSACGRAQAVRVITQGVKHGGAKSVEIRG